MIKSVVSTALPVDEKLEIQKNRIMPLRPDGKQKIFSVVTGTHGDELEGQYVCYRLNQILKNNREKLGGIVDILFVAGGYFLCEAVLYGPAGAAASVLPNLIQGVS